MWDIPTIYMDMMNFSKTLSGFNLLFCLSITETTTYTNGWTLKMHPKCRRNISSTNHQCSVSHCGFSRIFRFTQQKSPTLQRESARIMGLHVRFFLPFLRKQRVGIISVKKMQLSLVLLLFCVKCRVPKVYWANLLFF